MQNLLLIILTCTFLLWGCDRQAETPIQPSGQMVRVGVIGPFSGPDFPMGHDGLEGIRTVLEMEPLLNNGDTVELVIEDDQNDPELTIHALEKLANQDNVTAILFLSGSASSLAANAAADLYRIPVLVLLATHPAIAKGKKFVTQICFDNSFQGRVAALFVRDELLFERVGVLFDPGSDHSTSLAQEFVKKFSAIGGEVVKILPLSGDWHRIATDLESLRSEQVQLLYLPVSSQSFGDISTITKKMDWQVERMGRDGLVANLLRKHPKDKQLFEGVLGIDMYSKDIEKTAFGMRAAKTHRQIYKKVGSTFAAVGAEGMAILHRAMNRCRTKTDRACINRMVHDTNDFEGLMGRIAINANGKTERPLIVNRIRNGRNYFLVKVY